MSRPGRTAHPGEVRPSRLLALVLLAVVSERVPARAQAPVAHQRLAIVIEPMGAEHMLALGVRARLGDPEELLFTGAHAEAGVVSYTSPIYTRNGAYLQVSPLAFLVLRAELRHVQMWSIGMPGAGYFPLLQDGSLAEGGAATGWEAHLSATLQGLVPLGDTRLLIWNQTALESLTIGPAERYLSPRHDAALGRRDGTLTNAAMLLWEVDLTPRLHLRLGAYSDLLWVASDGYLAHHLGPLAMLHVDAPDPHVSSILPFVRFGAYTDGRRAGGVTALAGLLVDYE